MFFPRSLETTGALDRRVIPKHPSQLGYDAVVSRKRDYKILIDRLRLSCVGESCMGAVNEC